MNAEGSESEIDLLISTLEENVLYPEVSDLIFWSDDDLTPEEIVDKALEYKPIQL